MIRIFAAAVLFLLLSAGSAFGAEANFFFYNKLAALMLLNAVVGVFLTFFGAVIASRIWRKFRAGLARISRSRAVPVSAVRTRRPVPDTRRESLPLNQKVING